MRRVVSLLTAALLLAGCATRERANPFDPNNPDTSGRPAGFVALAGNGRVTLRWWSVTGSTLLGYQVFRRGPNDNVYIRVSGVLPVTAAEFIDVGVSNGSDYAYRLYFVFTAGLGSHPAEDVATPGTPVPWLVEASGIEALQITPDGRRIARRVGGFQSTNDIDVNPLTGVVWVADGAGRVDVYNPASDVRTSIPVGSPGAIVVDPYDGAAWICDRVAGLVYHFLPNGTAATLPISGVNTPFDVTVDVVDGSVWVVERGADRVSRFNQSGQDRIVFASVPEPSRIALDQTTRVAWVTSFTRGTVTRVDHSGVVLDTLDLFTTPFGIAVDAARARVWVADPGVGEVIALRRDGTVEFRLTGFEDAGELDVDTRTGEVWVVLGDPGQVVKIGPTGQVRRRLAGLATPIAIAVDPGPR